MAEGRIGALTYTPSNGFLYYGEPVAKYQLMVKDEEVYSEEVASGYSKLNDYYIKASRTDFKDTIFEFWWDKNFAKGLVPFPAAFLKEEREPGVGNSERVLPGVALDVEPRQLTDAILRTLKKAAHDVLERRRPCMSAEHFRRGLQYLAHFIRKEDRYFNTFLSFLDSVFCRFEVQYSVQIRSRNGEINYLTSVNEHAVDEISGAQKRSSDQCMFNDEDDYVEENEFGTQRFGTGVRLIEQNEKAEDRPLEGNHSFRDVKFIKQKDVSGSLVEPPEDYKGCYKLLRLFKWFYISCNIEEGFLLDVRAIQEGQPEVTESEKVSEVLGKELEAKFEAELDKLLEESEREELEKELDKLLSEEEPAQLKEFEFAQDVGGAGAVKRVEHGVPQQSGSSSEYLWG